MKPLFLILALMTFCHSAQATSLAMSTDALTGVETLANGKQNRLALVLEEGKILLSEQAKGDQALTIVSGEDKRGGDGDLTVKFSNGDELVVTAGFWGPVKYSLVRRGTHIPLQPRVEVQLK